MNQIKFRAWQTCDGEKYKMEYQNEKSLCEFFSLVSDKNLMQFTGLYDKNGVEIWENDLLMTEDGEIGKVYFDCGCFLTTLEEVEETSALFSHNPEECLLVIGNIYENPELLD